MDHSSWIDSLTLSHPWALSVKGMNYTITIATSLRLLEKNFKRPDSLVDCRLQHGGLLLKSDSMTLTICRHLLLQGQRRRKTFSLPFGRSPAFLCQPTVPLPNKHYWLFSSAMGALAGTRVQCPGRETLLAFVQLGNNIGQHIIKCTAVMAQWVLHSNDSTVRTVTSLPINTS